MRLILVKPTNATRRLDSTGEVFHDGDRERCTSGGPSPPTRNTEEMHDRHSRASMEASSSPLETSLCCSSSAPNEKSNGISAPRVSAQVSQLETQSVTLSQLSDQDWLLLCGQVSSVAVDPPLPSPSKESPGTSVGYPNHSYRRGCSCCDTHQHSETSICQPQSKRSAIQDCLSRVSNKIGLSTPPHFQLFPQSTQVSAHCQVLPHKTKQSKGNPAEKHPQFHFPPQCTDQEGQTALSYQQPCNHFKLKDSSQATCPDLFNIPLNSIECTETNKKFLQQPAVSENHNWKELFGKEPALVQTCQNQDSHRPVSGDETWKSSGDPSVILKCRHLPYVTIIPQEKRSSTPASNKSVQSFSTSLYSSQELVEERARQRKSQVQDISKEWCHLLISC